MPPGYSKARIKKPCGACGATLSARTQELSASIRAFTCQTHTADTTDGLPQECWIKQTPDSVDTLVALSAMSQRARSHDGKRGSQRAAKRAHVLLRYVTEVRAGEPSVAWYRSVLQEHDAGIVLGALAKMPYWKQDKLRLSSLRGIAEIDTCVSRVRSIAGGNFADLLAGYVDHHYELMAFGFDNDLFGRANPVKLTTLSGRIYKLAHYLQWLSGHGHESLKSAGPSWLTRYLADHQKHPSVAYQITKLYDWARKKYPFIPTVRYRGRGRGKYRDGFDVLKLGSSRETYARICSHPEPQGRALALLALLYAQRTRDSITLKRTDLQRDPESGLWMMARPDAEPFRIERELSEAFDECLALADQHVRRLGANEAEYVFPGRTLGHLNDDVARVHIKAASGCAPNILRRTSVVNMYRGGEKTMGTVVLRDVLNVSSPTIQKAIKMTGESVNSPMAREEADALRRAFLEADDD